jgi:ubiquitin
MNLFSKSLISKIVGSLLILSTVSYTAQAKSTSQEKKVVLKQASNFAQAVACYTTFEADSEYKTTVKDIYLIQKDQDYAEYFILWSGDWGCAGGSGTYRSYLTSFSKLAENRPLVVDKQDILGDINADGYLVNDRFIEDVKFEDGRFLITGSDFSNEGDDGGNNFPANRYKYTLALDSDDYKWKLIDKKFMGKTKDAIKRN